MRNKPLKCSAKSWNPEQPWWALTLSRDIESCLTPALHNPLIHTNSESKHTGRSSLHLYFFHTFSQTHAYREWWIATMLTALAVVLRADGRLSCVSWSLQTRTQQWRCRALNNTTDACLFIQPPGQLDWWVNQHQGHFHASKWRMSWVEQTWIWLRGFFNQETILDFFNHPPPIVLVPTGFTSERFWKWQFLLFIFVCWV